MALTSLISLIFVAASNLASSISKCVFSSTFFSSFYSSTPSVETPSAGAPPPPIPPPIYPMKGPSCDISSYCLNQLGLAGGQVPLASCLIEGQSRLIFIGSKPDVLNNLCLIEACKYRISKTFKSNNLSASMSTFFFYSSESSDSK